MKRKIPLIDIAILILIFTYASFLILFRLGVNPLYAWDEAFYAQISREIVANGDWLTLHWNFSPFFGKPPLLMWITAVFFSIFQVNEFWSRAASAIAGILLLIVVYLIARKELNRGIGVLAVIGLLTNPDYMWSSRHGMTDMLLALFIYLSILAYLYARNDQRYWYGIGIFFALAFMTKFWAAGVIPIILFITLALDARLKETVRSRHFWGGILLSLLILLPWHIRMLVIYPGTFMNEYILYNLVIRSSSGIEQNTGTTMYYFDFLKNGYSPWFALIPFAVVNSLNEFIHKAWNKRPPMFLVLILVLFSLYSFLIQTKLSNYILPIQPAIYILISTMLVKAFRSYKSFAFSAVIYSAFIALLVVVGRLQNGPLNNWKQFLLAAIALGMITILIIVFSYALGKPRVRLFFGRFRSKLEPFFPKKNVEITDPPSVHENPRKLAFTKGLVGIIAVLFWGTLMAKSVSTYIFAASPIAEISKIAGETKTDQPLIFMSSAVSGDYPTVLFYSNRPLIGADVDSISTVMSTQGAQDVILADQDKQFLSTEYEFHPIAYIPPFYYATIKNKPLP